MMTVIDLYALLHYKILLKQKFELIDVEIPSSKI